MEKHSPLRWIIRLSFAFMIAFLLFRLSPPRPLVIIGSPKTVLTTHPIVGVHTRLTDEVEEWKIQKTLQMVREMGAPTIVEFFPWAYVQSEKGGEFDWSHSDLVIDHAVSQGIDVIARLGTVPAWARPDPEIQATTWNWLDEEHFDDFALYVSAFVEQYQGKVNKIIIWNEPNLAFEWGMEKPDPFKYSRLLAKSYQAAKGANPKITVLGGALAPTLEPEDSNAGMNDLVFLERMYEEGASAYFDALAVHAYGWAFPPKEPPSAEVINFRRVELLHDIMLQYGDAHKPVYITESGWNDHPRWSKAVRPGQRVQYTLDALAYAETHWPWVKSVAIWAFRFPAPQRSYADYFALVTPDFSPKMIYQSLQEYTQP
ncbi:MAG: hypothetical protein ABFQ89_00065 [Chloroflexota bacterium]